MSAPAELARGWIGTPYAHGASVRGAGCDCLGLVQGVWRALHDAPPLALPPYAPDWDARAADALLAGLARHLSPATGPLAAGQVLAFRLRAGGAAKHLGILTRTGPDAAFVHAYARHGVVESPLAPPWARRIVARFWLQERAD